MARIDQAQGKWDRKVKKMEKHWLDAMSDSKTGDRFISGVADFTELSVDTVKNSRAGKKYLEFNNDIVTNKENSIYYQNYKGKIEAASEAKTWSKNYKKAFGATGT